MAVGRLDPTEFDERLTAALSARTASDLEPLFSDLPGPRPGQEVATTAPFTAPPWQASDAVATPQPAAHVPHMSHPGMNSGLMAAITAIIWPATILFITLGPGWASYWWLVFLPIFVTSAMGKNRQDQSRERQRIEREQRDLDRRRRALGD